jgi:ATP-binding cassette subfamily B (MDR/TAP) protein 1
LLTILQVSFSYPVNPQEKVVDDATFFFPSGETTFIVGSSGSGKSTIGNLIMKYYEPSRGEILLDNIPLQTIEPEWLRQNVTLVQQDSVLFNESIRQNIAFGRIEPPTADELTVACQTANLEQTLRDLPKGLETVAGPGGQGLSGGQQQRVVIARARLRDSPLLILDEATSSLDKKSREKVMAEIRKWREKKTTIIITHDVSQIQDHEFVYVMENGRPVEEGFRKNLAEKKIGPFATLLSAAESSTSSTLQERRESLPSTSTTPRSSFDGNMLHREQEQTPRPFGMPGASPNIGTIGGGRNSFIFGGIVPVQGSSLFSDISWISSAILNDGSVGLPQFIPRRKSSTRVNPQPSTFNNSRFSRNFEFLRRGSTVLVMPGRSSSSRGLVRPQRIAFRPGNLEAATESQQHIIEPPVELAEAELTGQAILAPEVDSLRKPASLSVIFRTVWPNLQYKDRVYLVLGFVAATIMGGLTSAFAYVFTQLLSVYYLPSGRGEAARMWALILLGIGLMDGISIYFMHYTMEYCGQTWINKLRREALKRILAQPRAWFDKERNSASNLNTTLDRHAEEMRNLIGRFAGPIYTVAWILGISVIWSLLISLKLTLVALAFSPFMYILIQTFNIISGKWETRCNEAADRTGNVFTETFANIRVVRALTLEHYFKRKHTAAAIDTFKIGRSRAIWACGFFGLGDTISLLLTATVFYYGSVIITAGQLSVTTCLQVVNLLMFGIAGSVGFLGLVPQLSSSQSAASYLLHLANLSLSETSEVLGKRRLNTPFPVIFNELTFTYPKQFVPVLKGISFTLHPGSCTGIVGSSGSGKSTIASLLLGLYAPDEVPFACPDPLSFRGISIRRCNIASLRNQIAIVAQKPLLFPSSVLANIIYGLPEGSPFANLNSAIQAAKDAGIHDFIMGLTDGYSTIVGDGGQGVSGGQAQRIAIARALVRQPRILILDEATSALDAVSAEAIRETVRMLIKRGKDSNDDAVAVVIISHAVEMMRICGQLVMLEHGKVVEKGTFEELSALGGAFADLVGISSHSPKEGGGLGIDNVMSPVEKRTKQNWFRKTST